MPARTRPPGSRKPTYYNAFPKNPRKESILVAIFWVIANDYRAISTNEKRNVVYPAKAAGLVENAPANERGVPVNLKGETSCCGFVLTPVGKEYYEKIIKPVIGDEKFTSATPIMPRRMVAKDLPIETIKESVQA